MWKQRARPDGDQGVGKPQGPQQAREWGGGSFPPIPQPSVEEHLPVPSSLLNTQAQVGPCTQSHYPVMTGPGIHTQVKGDHLWAGQELSRYERSRCCLCWRLADGPRWILISQKLSARPKEGTGPCVTRGAT